MTRYSPQWLQSGSYAASLDRRLIGALWPAPACQGCAVSAVGTGMDLHVDPGQVAVPSPNNTGSVLCSSDAIETVTLAPAPPAGTDRVDLIVCQPRSVDLDGVSTQEDFIFAIVAGAEGAPPGAPPAVPAGTVALAQVHVAGGSASLAPANITDRRPSGLAIPLAPPASYPRGYVAYSTGPASQVVVAGTVALVHSIGFTALAGRRYKMTAQAGYFGTAGGAVGTNNQIRFRLDGVDTQVQSSPNGPGSNLFAASHGYAVISGDGASHSFGIAAISGAPAGASLTFGPNYVRLLAEDIGGA